MDCGAVPTVLRSPFLSSEEANEPLVLAVLVERRSSLGMLPVCEPLASDCTLLTSSANSVSFNFKSKSVSRSMNILRRSLGSTSSRRPMSAFEVSAMDTLPSWSLSLRSKVRRTSGDTEMVAEPEDLFNARSMLASEPPTTGDVLVFAGAGRLLPRNSASLSSLAILVESAAGLCACELGSALPPPPRNPASFSSVEGLRAEI
mmetsp:Transcript_25988/g.79028  ORF Transcript_25988/g.79028 Transcript_25988/m.79028 type:complete len:203 (+) Transcript_25988:509-1117(+)